MLPDRLIELRTLEDGTRAPSWLTSRDEVWLRPFCDEIEAFAARHVAGVEKRVRELADRLSREHGVNHRRLEAVWTIERRRWRKHIDAPVEPQRLRSVIFDIAARASREDAIARASETFGIDRSVIEKALFADRDGARLLLPPPTFATPRDLVDGYNLALAQSLLARAIRVRATLRSDVSHVLSFAKLLGLMVLFAERDDGAVDIELSGPLALFHETTKYGHAVARFLPALTSTVGWSAIAQIRFRGEGHVLALSASDPLPRVHALPRSYDSKIEKRLAIDLKKLGPERGWHLERETTVVRARVGAHLFYPDFTLVSDTGQRRVLVEIVGFWTPEYLEKKRAALDAVEQPIVVCVHDRHAAELGLPNGEHAIVITYRDRIDATALLDAAERARARC